MIYDFVVFGQKLTLANDPYVVSDTIDFLTAHFRFSGEWDGLEKHAIFDNGNDTYDVTLTNDEILESDHLNLTSGTWQISVAGVEYVDAVISRRITTQQIELPVVASGRTSGEPFPPASGSTTCVNVNQATPQTFVGGIPKLAEDRVIDHDNELADKKYVDDKVATVTADDFNHNDLANKQGGSAGEYYHTTQAQNAALHAHANKAALDAVSGTNTGDQTLPTRDSLGLDTDDTVTFANLSGMNTGDQDVSGAISTHNSDTDAHQSIQSDIRTAEAALQQVGSQLAENTNDIVFANKRLDEIYVYWPEFEVGQVYVNGTALTYTTNTKLIRNKQGTSFRLRVGDVVKSNDESKYKFIGGYANGDGTFTAIGWRTAAYTAPVDGEYYFTFAHVDGTAIGSENISSVVEDFSIIRESSIKYSVDRNSDAVAIHTDKLARNDEMLADLTGEIYLPAFELGVVESIPGTGFTYVDSPARIRTPQGVTIPLKKWDVITSTDWTAIKILGGYKREDGTYYQMSTRAEDFEMPEDGEVVLCARNAAGTTITNIEAITDLLSIIRPENLTDTVERDGDPDKETLPCNSKYYANGIMRRAYNPYLAGGAETLAGQLHCHVRYRDSSTGEVVFYGGDSNAVALANYSSFGYDFVTFTDYGHLESINHPDDVDIPAGLTWLFDSQEASISGSGTPNASLQPAKHSCVYNSISAYATQPKMHWQKWARMVKPTGEMISIAHPFWTSTYQQPEVLNLIKGRIRFCEIYNGEIASNYTSTFPDGKGTDFAWEVLLDNGCVTWGIAVNDAHTCTNEASIKNGCVKVFASENERFEILENLCAGNFYACSNIAAAINSVSFANGVLTIDVGDAGASTQFLKEGGAVLATETGATATYALVGTEKYVRAVITLSSGHTVWTQPIINLFSQDYDDYLSELGR